MKVCLETRDWRRRSFWQCDNVVFSSLAWSGWRFFAAPAWIRTAFAAQNRFHCNLQIGHCTRHQESAFCLQDGRSASLTAPHGPSQQVLFVASFVLSRAQQKALLCSGSHQGFVNIAIQTAPSTPGSIQLLSLDRCRNALGLLCEKLGSGLWISKSRSRLSWHVEGMWKTCRAPHELSGSRATGTARNGNSTWRSHRGHCPANSWRCLHSPGLSADGHVPWWKWLLYVVVCVHESQWTQWKLESQDS